MFFLLSIFVTGSLTNLPLFFYINDDTDNGSYTYYYYYQSVYGTTEERKLFTVLIPKGSANPEVDITKLGPMQWYLPRQITVHTNDTITWKNNDTEAHTVTSGASPGIESLMNNKRGTPNGIFDSGSFQTRAIMDSHIC